MDKFQPYNQNIPSNKTILPIMTIIFLVIALSVSCYFANSFYKIKINLEKSNISLQNKLNDNMAENLQLQTQINQLQAKLVDTEARKQEMDTKKSEPTVYINDGVVYYTNGDNRTITIARSIRDSRKPDGTIEPEKDKEYKQAKLSPDKKYIALLWSGFEWMRLEVYDIDSGEIHKANVADSDFAWLSDNRLIVNGSCGMGIACGIWESTTGKAPWELKNVGN